jgi:hypothetical protein
MMIILDANNSFHFYLYLVRIKCLAFKYGMTHYDKSLQWVMKILKLKFNNNKIACIFDHAPSNLTFFQLNM